MGEVVHTSRVVISRMKGTVRKALIEGFSQPIFYGVHGGIKHFYGVEPEEEHAATLDHIVAATAAWMMGTLARVLANHQILTPEDRYRAEVEGDIEDVEGVLKIVRIRVHYRLKIPPGKEEVARRSLDTYLPHCPAAQSVIGCIQISHQLTLEVE